MPYIMLIMEDRDRRRNRPEGGGHREYDRMLGFVEDLKRRGVYVASESLRVDGTRVAVQDGKRIVVDGPFAEAKEIVGGFFLLDCATREQAIAIACECPATQWATIEVREVGPCHAD